MWIQNNNERVWKRRLKIGKNRIQIQLQWIELLLNGKQIELLVS